MRGTDCTPKQLGHASDFLADRGWPDNVNFGSQRREDVARLLAWYGVLRYQAGRDGTGGSLEEPSALEVVKKSTREAGASHIEDRSQR